MTLPPETTINPRNTHRLIPSKYGDSVLTRIANDDDHLNVIFELDSVTNDRLSSENNILPGVSALELVSGFQYYTIVNAAYCHAQPEGSRFNGPERGAWYAGYNIEGSLAEVVFHKTLALQEIDMLFDEVTYTDYMADFNGNFHDIRNQENFSDCLDPESYISSQQLASQLLKSGSSGIVYPNVGKDNATNLVCFRPALVNNVKKGKTYSLKWNGNVKPHIHAHT